MVDSSPSHTITMASICIFNRTRRSVARLGIMADRKKKTISYITRQLFRDRSCNHDNWYYRIVIFSIQKGFTRSPVGTTVSGFFLLHWMGSILPLNTHISCILYRGALAILSISGRIRRKNASLLIPIVLTSGIDCFWVYSHNFADYERRKLGPIRYLLRYC